MTGAIQLDDQRVKAFQEDVQRLETALKAVIVGQEAIISQLLATILAKGHVLIEGMPGLGKTHLAKAVARSVGLSFSRIQCTPDLMPADITGSEILVNDPTGGGQRFEFRPGPVFSSILLVDEINRATPKTQAALLEAMQESQVTNAGTIYRLPVPFCVLATQNAIELEGTYPLPEAQLDRFLAKIVIGFPSRQALQDLVATSLDLEPADLIEQLLGPERIVEMMLDAQETVISDYVRDAAVDLILTTHPDHGGGNSLARKYFQYGASPRALQALLRIGRVLALADGRGHVAIEDLTAIALPVLRHRVYLTIESELENINIDDILGDMVSEWSKTK